MSFDTNSLLANLLVSSLGFVVLSYGRKMQRVPQIVAGVALCVYPYFVPGALLMLAIGVGILGALWVAVRSGY
jgi:hypothetical protein